MHLSSSVRSLVTNYLKYFNKDIDNNIHFIKENNSKDEYIIYEDYFGTHILTSNVLDLYEELKDINVDYFVIDTLFIDSEIIDDVVKLYLNNDVKLIDTYRNKINVTKGFIDTKTMYKVKHYE